MIIYVKKGFQQIVGDKVLFTFSNGSAEVETQDKAHYNEYLIIDTSELIKEKTIAQTKEASIAKKEALNSLVITHNSVAYDANGKAIGNMAAVMGIANFKYNQAVANGATPIEAYQAIYKDSKIWWKGSDNAPHEIMIESVCEALQKSMIEVSNILGL